MKLQKKKMKSYTSEKYLIMLCYRFFLYSVKRLVIFMGWEPCGAG